MSNADDPFPPDLTIGSFSDTPPWIVDPEAIEWLNQVAAIRWVTHRDIPDLIRPKRFPGIRTLRVVLELASALAPWALRKRGQGGHASRVDISIRLRTVAENLGPTYIKLGQIISSGDGLFPSELVEEFKKCRDRVPPEPFITIRQVVEEDLGKSLEDVFISFDREPLAAASIAQVHAATLRTGENVVVKVQRPSVSELVHADIRVMAWLAPRLIGRIPVAALANPPALVELFAQTITEELDFRLEAANMLDVARSFADLGQRGYVIPRPHPTLVTRRVLVMERLNGFTFSDVAAMQAAGVDTAAVIRTGMIGFMEGAMINGIFHGDLHGGNLFVMPDGRVALLDFGITGRLDEPRRLAFLRLLMAATMNDVKGQLAALRDLGALPLDSDLDEVIVEMGLDRPPVDPTTLSPDEMVHEVQRIIKQLLGFGASLPKELMLFVKNMVFLDGAIATLAPDLDLIAEMAHISAYFAIAHGERIATEIGIDPRQHELDIAAVKEGLGIDPSVHTMTYRDLQQRRALIRSRLERRSPNPIRTGSRSRTVN